MLSIRRSSVAFWRSVALPESARPGVVPQRFFSSQTDSDDEIENMSLAELQENLENSSTRVEKLRKRLRTYRGKDAGRRILVLGAGRSSTSLIKYFLEHSVKQDWTVYVGDADENLAREKIGNNPRGVAFKLNAYDQGQMSEEIKQSNIVISLLPQAMHQKVQEQCLSIGRNMVTASYLSPFVTSIAKEVEKKNLLFMNECGLDPGIDHMLTMKKIDAIRRNGGVITRFESFCGGLVDDESVAGNPWKYKFTWNPRNVVLAGQSGCRFVQQGSLKIIPYSQVFRRIETLRVPGHGEFEGYANRDSLSYRELYNLHDVGTLFRGTLRRPGFCGAWDVLVRLGMTNDTMKLNTELMTYRQFTNLFLPYRPQDSVELKVAYQMNLSLDDGGIFHRLQWLGLFDSELIGLKEATPAQVLQQLLEQKWQFRPGVDRDMIPMLNKYEYESADSGERRELQSSMVVFGNKEDTAMSMTVGYPAAIVAKLILNGEIDRSGVAIPTTPDIYNPILQELEDMGIEFHDRDRPIGLTVTH